MKQKTRTILLTLLGQPYRLGAGQGDRALFLGDHQSTRRAMLVVRLDETPHKLRSRVMDSIVRLAGGPVVGRRDLADRIVEGLRLDPNHAPNCRGWTLAHLEDDSAADPYAPRSPRLTLIDSPTHRPSRGRRGPGRWLSTKPVKRSAKPQAAFSLQ